MYSSHYMYLGLVTFFHTLYLFDIYIYIYNDDVCFSLYLTCCLFSLFIHVSWFI